MAILQFTLRLNEVLHENYVRVVATCRADHMIVIGMSNHLAATYGAWIANAGSHGHTPCNTLPNRPLHHGSPGSKALGLHACKRSRRVFLRCVPLRSPYLVSETLNQCQHVATWLQDLLFKTVSVGKFPNGFAFDYSVLSQEATMTVYSFVTYDARSHDTPPRKGTSVNIIIKNMVGSRGIKPRSRSRHQTSPCSNYTTSVI